MGLFGKLFGGGSFDDHRAEGDRLFVAERFEDARLAYDKALDRKKGASAEAVAHCEARVRACLDEMARARLAEAERLAGEGHLDLAEGELRNAMELAADEAIAKQARRRLDTLEQEDAVRQAEGPEEMDDEDRWAILAGSWEEEQLEEYDAYGEPFREALLALHDGDVETGRPALEAILEQAEAPLYLWLEVGRARASAEDLEGAEEALRAFLDGLEEGRGGEARLGAHASLAALRDQDEDEEGAIAEFEAAMEAFPDDPRPFFLMGRYLRGIGSPAEAAQVLEAALPLLDEDRPDWRYFEELGLAWADAEEPEKAAVHLDRVIAFFVGLRRHDRPLDFPPATAVARAKLYEAEGRLDKAADLYRSLAHGSDRENHLTYHREAGRLLTELELHEEARRMLTRALALAEDDEEARADLEARLEALE
jgi:tetratricopeptide (TPR) repeat protein